MLQQVTYSMKNYPTIEYIPFGRDLLSTYDLDPLYPALVQAGMSDSQLKRWLLAYWCYYSAGASSHISEYTGLMFWDAMERGIPTYPRGHERRHWRGNAARLSLADMRTKYAYPEDVVDYMTAGRTFKDVSDAVQEFKGFGPWISWKVADMAERVLQNPVDFSDANLFMYRDPVKGAALVYHGDQYKSITPDELQCVVDMTLDSLSRLKAPPFRDRPINIQEVETILCKWKSHMNGYYPLGNDSYEIAHGLHGWGETADLLYKCLQEVTSYPV